MSPPTKIAEGSFATVYEIDAMRVSKRFRDKSSGDAIKYEAMMAEHARNAGIPTPQVRDVDLENGTIIFDKIEGITLVNVVKNRPWTVFWAAREMARLFARIHKVNASSFGAKSLHDQIAEQIQGCSAVPDHKQAHLLASIKPAHPMSRLCHFDFHPENVMFDDQQVHVIDWGSAKQGHPLLDITQTVVMNRVDRILQEPGNPPTFVVRLLRKAYIEAFLFFYARFSRDFTYREIRQGIAKLSKAIAAARLANAKPYETQKLRRMIEA